MEGEQESQFADLILKKLNINYIRKHEKNNRIIKQVDYMLNTAISLPWQKSIKKLILCNLNFIV